VKDRLFNRQFLFTTSNRFDLPWECIKIANFNLYHHPNIELTQLQTPKVELYLLGFLLDYEVPSLSNLQILEHLSQFSIFTDFCNALNRYSGQFVVIYKSETDFIIVTDACAHYEVYYDTTFSTFGTQPKLLEKVVVAEEHTNPEAIEFFSKPPFLVKKVFVGNTTHRSNILHLLPNHFIDINKKSIARFFPAIPRIEISVDEAATKAISMLKGYIKAASLRTKLAMGVTAGYDSRILFLMSLETECEYFIFKHRNMSNDHYDIVTPQKLTAIHGKAFEVIPDAIEKDTTPDYDLLQSIDFPRGQFKSEKLFENHFYINGFVSEIARNYYGYTKNITAADLSYLNGYPNNPYVEKICADWLNKNAKSINDLGYNFLDLFYWEEKMGNWGAKAKTEAALDRVIYSPFCSRDLLITLLATNRKYRDSHLNVLYNRIIKILSPKASKIPINPCLMQRIIRLMKILRVFNLYRTLGLKFHWLNI